MQRARPQTSPPPESDFVAPPSPWLVFWHRYGTWILLGLALVSLLVVFLQYRARAAEAERIQASSLLAETRSEIDTLRGPNLLAADPARALEARRSVADRVEPVLDSILSTRSEPSMLAEALVLRGDLHLILSRQPPTTQPASAPAEDLSRHTATARDAYQQVVDRYADQPVSLAAARFGLATIAEESADWAAAEAQYKALADATDLPQAVRNLATQRLTSLAQLQRPAYLSPIVPATAPADPAATQPAAAAPVAAEPASTQPLVPAPAVEPAATQPAADGSAVAPEPAATQPVAP